jgi:protein required for attachment to host cells
VNTFILACDAGSARLFDETGRSEPWRLVETIDNASGRAHVRDLVADHPGRVRQSGTGAQPPMEPPTDPAEREAERFARRLASDLDRAFGARAFDRLVLVAPPRFLGRLREALRPAVAAAVVGEVDRDYTKAPAAELEARVRSLLEDR